MVELLDNNVERLRLWLFKMWPSLCAKRKCIERVDGVSEKVTVLQNRLKRWHQSHQQHFY